MIPRGLVAHAEISNFDLGHVEPAPMLRRVMELHALQNAPSLGWLEGFIQGSSSMRVQVILHDAHVFGVRIDRIDQPLDALRVVELGTALRHLDMAPARQRRGR